MSSIPAPAAIDVHGLKAARVTPVRAGWNEVGMMAGLVFLWLAATAWARPLMLPDEGRYVGVAWEMMSSGDWLVPTLNGLPFFHKPPLFYWITTGAMSVLGPNEWAARAAPLLGAWLGAISLYLFARRWSGEDAARLTLLALLAQPLFYIGGQFANMDMLVAGCITATIVLFAHAALCFEQNLPCGQTLAGAWALAALGVLAKGLIGIVTPALVIVPWLLMLRRWRALQALAWGPGIVLFLLLAAPWFIAMQLRFTGFMDYFFVVQHFKRFAQGGFNNVQPFWFYPAILLLACLPWLPWMYRSFTRGRLHDPERGSIRLLMCLWVAMMVLFFSLPKSKLLGYILPAVPPLVFLVVDGLLALGAPSLQARRLWWASVVSMALLSLGMVVGLATHPLHSSRDLARALRAQRSAQEPVFMIDHYDYDVPFYAHLRAPVKVVEHWSSAEVQQQDDWRKELADAGRFATARSVKALIDPEALPAALCQSAVNWVIGPVAAADRYPFLAQASVAYAGKGRALWKVDTETPASNRMLHCEARLAADAQDH